MKNFVGQDEISVTDIISSLKRSWRIVVACVCLGGAVATTFTLIASEKYEVKIYLDLPRASELADINSNRISLSGLSHVTPEEVFDFFIKELQSDEAKVRFFTNTYLPSMGLEPSSEKEKLQLMQAVLKNQIKVVEPKLKERREYSVRVEAPTAEKAVEWMNAFLTSTEDEARSLWLKNARSNINLAIQNSSRELSERLQLARQLRLDKSARLNEAFHVAKAAGIINPQVTVARLPSQDNMASFTDGSGLFERGVKSLQAELGILNERKDEAPFMEGVRESELRLKLLQEQKPEDHRFRMYRLDGPLHMPTSPFSPQKALYIVMGLIVGLMIGLVMAIKRNGLFRFK